MQFSKIIALAATVALAVATPIELPTKELLASSPKEETAPGSGTGRGDTNVNTGNVNSRNCNIGQHMGQVSCCNSVNSISNQDQGLLDVLGFNIPIGVGLGCVLSSACNQKAVCCTGDVNQSTNAPGSGLVNVNVSPNVNLCSLSVL